MDDFSNCKYMKEGKRDINKLINNYLLFDFTFTCACFGIKKDDEFSGMAHEFPWCFRLCLEKSFLHLSRFGLITMLIRVLQLHEGVCYACVCFMWRTYNM